MRNVLITGGAGFIGSNFIEYFLQKYPQYFVINLDALTYAGSLENLANIKSKNYKFVHGNICDSNLVSAIFSEFDIDFVVHFAAESHVDNSIKNPSAFVSTNVNGTFNLLHNAYLAWFNEPHCIKKGKEHHRFHHISTDEVFGSIDSGAFSESSPYAPNSPYSASKASSDMLVRSYFHTYGLQTLITNCSNNYGPKQHDEKLIPTIIRKALRGEQIPIYGDGKNVRDWLFVLDHCKGIDAVLHSKYFGDSFNIGGNCEKQNIQIATEICHILDSICPKKGGISYSNQIEFVKDRAGHDRRYAINCEKITKLLGYKISNYEQNLALSVAWYVDLYTRRGGGGFYVIICYFICISSALAFYFQRRICNAD